MRIMREPSQTARWLETSSIEQKHHVRSIGTSNPPGQGSIEISSCHQPPGQASRLAVHLFT